MQSQSSRGIQYCSATPKLERFLRDQSRGNWRANRRTQLVALGEDADTKAAAPLLKLLQILRQQ